MGLDHRGTQHLPQAIRADKDKKKKKKKKIVKSSQFILTRGQLIECRNQRLQGHILGLRAIVELALVEDGEQRVQDG